MEFQFLDPGPLLDRELELIEPSGQHIEEMLAACRHPLSLSDRAAKSMTRQRLEDLLKLAPRGHQSGEPERGIVPSYHFWMRLHAFEGGEPAVRMAGGIGIRIGITHDLEMYLGQVGYNVFPPARGHHYAERACRLLLPLVRAHAMRTLWITCNPDNAASRRTCERLGCTLVEIVPVPPGHSLYHRGEYQKCRYRLDL